MRIALGAVALSLGLVACASASPPAPVAATTLSSGSAPACTGAQFDADDPDPRCLRHQVGEAPPPVSSLAVSVHADSIAKSGGETVLIVEMRNVSAAPLTLDVDSACAFDATATDGTTSSFESDCGGLCGRGAEPSVLHVTLEPGGVVVKRVHFFASQTRVSTNAHDQCEEHAVGALPPGRYTLTVTLPWAYPSPELPGRLDARTVDVPLTVTP